MADEQKNRILPRWGRLWVILIVGLSLIAAAVVARHYRLQPAEVGDAPPGDLAAELSRLAESQAAAQKQVQAWQQSTAFRKARADALETAVGVEKSKGAAQKNRAEDLLARGKAIEARIKELGGRIASTAPAAPDAAASETSPARAPSVAAALPHASGPAPSITSAGGAARAVEGVSGLFAAEYPKLSPDSAGRIAMTQPIDLFKHGKAATVRIEWPVEAKDLAFQINTTRKDCVSIEQAVADPLGQRKVYGEASVDGGVLRWKWGVFNATHVNLTLLEKLVKYARLVVGDADGRDLAGVQWVVPQEVAVTLDGPAAKLSDCAAGCETGLVLSPDAAGTWVEGNRGAGPSLQVKSSGGTMAKVAIRAEAGKAEVQAFGSGKVAYDELDKTIPSLNADAVRLDKEIATMDAAILRSSSRTSSDSATIAGRLRDVTSQLNSVEDKLANAPQALFSGPYSSAIDARNRLRAEKAQLEADQARHERAQKNLVAARDQKKQERVDVRRRIDQMQSMKASAGRQEPGAATPPDFEVRVVAARSNVILARVKVACKN